MCKGTTLHCHYIVYFCSHYHCQKQFSDNSTLFFKSTLTFPLFLSYEIYLLAAILSLHFFVRVVFQFGIEVLSYFSFLDGERRLIRTVYSISSFLLLSFFKHLIIIADGINTTKITYGNMKLLSPSSLGNREKIRFFMIKIIILIQILTQIRKKKIIIILQLFFPYEFLRINGIND